uniref:Uncharacterized protein n=1 Tax=Moniliophthora roreri TaxID=221103 RepID=A0A0W0G9U4_MONRR
MPASKAFPTPWDISAAAPARPNDIMNDPSTPAEQFIHT